ncbi:amidohydrolase [Lentibacillus sp. CBA3610]|uniref:amidohydrolase n=1 Tax=Lentibacillus sp. CBA3610 TaxID=2518176 RepID=UPI001595FF84|nr:amidohydrolase [Lentibacillus sp. CBA3610]QKY70419.1 amidohydrolase [Lentibacillus sp. CBA3610]
MHEVELLFTNANVLTMDDANPRAGSIAISDGVIAGIWNDPEPPKHEVDITKNTAVINLHGATLLPGFIDTHNHILMYALMADKINCGTPPNHSITDILSAIRQRALETVDGNWIEGYGFDDTLVEEKRHILRRELDDAAPNNPVFIRHISGHLGYANSLALEYAGLHDDISDPKSGHFGRDENGRLNGVLYEYDATDPVSQLIPDKTIDKKVDDLGKAAKEYLAHGITTNSDAKVSNLNELDVHLKAARQGVNPMRTRLMVMHNLLSDGAAFGNYSANQLNREIQDKSGGLATLDSAKMFQDGSIQGLTGALRSPYYNDAKHYGDLIHDQESFQEEVLDLHQRGYRVTTHGNGDRAIGSIIDVYDYALEKHPKTGHKHRIEHVQSGTPEDIRRMGMLGIAGSFFINHVYYWGDRHEGIFLGPERARRISPLADAIDQNLLFTLHSDCPVTPISPLFSVWAAVNRVTRDGNILGPEQRIDVMTALKSMTIYGAQLNFEEEQSGSIEVGKQADFAVLDKDPTAVDPIAIKDISVQGTFIGGKQVYEKEGLETS